MKITLLTDGVSPYVIGGMQRHSALLAQHLVRAGVNVDLCHTAHDPEAVEQAKCLAGFPEDVRKKIGNVFVEYPKCGKLPGHYLRDSYKYSQALLEKYLLKSTKVDFIYAQGQTGRAFVEAKHAGIKLPPIGINAHGYEMFQWASDFRTKMAYWMLQSTFKQLSLDADYVFSFSGKIREIVEHRIGVQCQQIIEVPNGVEKSWLADTVSPIREKIGFVFIGRYERRKGVPDLVNAALLLAGENCEIHFIGPIPSSFQVEHSSIHYHGKTTNSKRIQDILDGCDVLVCPSYAEGMPTVILEAMARGLAIIATDVGAVRELVGPNNGVLMVEAGGDPLIKAMDLMLHLDSDKLQAMKQRSLDKVAGYSWDNVARMTIGEIQEKLSSQ